MSKVITFLYVWKKSDEFELENSVKLARKNYPNCRIVLVGDEPKTKVDLYIPHRQVGKCKAKKTSSSILHAAKQLENFVLMNDDTFLNTGFDFTNAYHRGQLVADNNLGNYNLNIINTIKFLEYYNKPLYNFECHQPFMFDSDKLLTLFNTIEIEHHHLMKSIYCNYYNLENGFKPNLKTNNVKDASKHYENNRCFSTTDDITRDMKNFITSLTAEYPQLPAE